MISATGDYALRVVAFLALDAEASFTSQAIVEATGVPAGYLVKVMGSLARAGLVGAQRGLHGGYRLLRAPRGLSALEVLEAVEGRPGVRAREGASPVVRDVERLVEEIERGAQSVLGSVTMDRLSGLAAGG